MRNEPCRYHAKQRSDEHALFIKLPRCVCPGGWHSLHIMQVATRTLLMTLSTSLALRAGFRDMQRREWL